MDFNLKINFYYKTQIYDKINFQKNKITFFKKKKGSEQKKIIVFPFILEPKKKCFNENFFTEIDF